MEGCFCGFKQNTTKRFAYLIYKRRNAYTKMSFSYIDKKESLYQSWKLGVAYALDQCTYSISKEIITK